MKRISLYSAVFLTILVLTGCDPVADSSQDMHTPDTRAITSFSFKAVSATTEISEPSAAEGVSTARSAAVTDTECTITVYVPQDTDVSCLIPEITFEGDTISPDPLSVRDYSEPVKFTVTAENPAVAPRVYTVTVKQLQTATDWLYTGETFSQFAADVTQLEDGEYRIRFPEETELSANDVLAIRDALAKKENTNKLFRLDFTGCILEADTLPKYAFSLPAKGKGVENLLSVVLPEGLVKIDGFAFEYCKNLQTVVLPVSLQGIGEEAFLGCKNVSVMKIRKGVDLLGAWVFGNFTREQTVIMDFSEAPETWAPTWSYKCRATIEWADPEDPETEE